MNRKNNISMNIVTAVSTVICAAAIGTLASSVSLWILTFLLIPAFLAGCATYNFYRLGYVWGRIDEYNRTVRLTEKYDQFMKKVEK